MIIFKSISWKNFLSTGNSANKVFLNKSQTTLIIGKNGEGKSTILDALCFSLFGKPFRNINKNQLVNSINGKNCVVEIDFSIGTKEYKIIRGIKPNIFEIYVDGDMINQDAAVKDYQKVLEQQILKLNHKTFTQVVILGSASFVPFMQLPSTQRRDVIEDILDIRIFSTMNTLLKDKISETKETISRIENEIALAKGLVDTQTNLIKSLTEAKSDNIKSLLSKVEQNNKEIEETQKQIKEVISDIAFLSTATKEKDSLTEQLEKAKITKNKVTAKIEHCEHNHHFFNNNHICPTCSQDILEEHKTKAIEELNEKITTNNLMIQELDNLLEKLTKDLTNISNVQNTITQRNIELSTMNGKITLLNKMNSDLASEIESSKADTSNVDDEKKKLKDLAKEAIAKIEEKTELQEYRNLQEVANILLKDTGVKTAIIREYLPVMNKMINKYLNAMDAYIHFELDEAFNEHVKSRFRDDFTYASFSEGEKMRIDLAILFTWRQIAKMKNSVNTNLLILDEIFDSSLDAAGTDYFVNLMNQFGDNSNIFVISHKSDQLFDKFRSVIKFEKRNDFSIIA